MFNVLIFPCVRSFFFFSSRRRHTRWPRDWSSDVCSSDLLARPVGHKLEPVTQDSSYTNLMGQQIVNGNMFRNPWVGETKPWNMFDDRIIPLNFTFIDQDRKR